jgi:tRNA threonylcarbamoyladenosine biosynthesis protein TsaB
MRVLAFDTATAATAVALCDVGSGQHGLDLEARDDPPAGARPGHARRLLALIEQLLDAGGGWEGVDRIAVGVGPGTFTGLRIGVATAHALARARTLELVGVSTLQALAAAARVEHPDAAILAAIDARRGEAFAAAWPAGADPACEPPSAAPAALPPQELARLASALAPEAVAVGDGAVQFRTVLDATGVVVPASASVLHLVSARVHCRLAGAAQPGRPDAVLPAYLRLADAELNRSA